MTHVMCTVDLENICIIDQMLSADVAVCPDVDCARVGAIVLHEAAYSTKQNAMHFDGKAKIIQWQSPPLGLCKVDCDTHVTLTGFCLYADDAVDYNEFKSSVSKSDPCEIVCQLDDCLLELALDKGGKAGFSHRDTTVTFRRPDVPFIKSMRDEYRMKCEAKKNCGRSLSRRFRIPIC